MVKVNLITVLQNPKYMIKLQKRMNEPVSHQADEVRDFLCQYLPNRILNYVNDHIILDIGDMLLSLVNEDELADLIDVQSENLKLKRKQKRVEGEELEAVKIAYANGLDREERLKSQLTSVDGDELKEDLKLLRQNIMKLQQTYNRKFAVIKHQRALAMGRPGALKSLKSVEGHNFAMSQIRAILRQLNAMDEYKQYNEGYYYEEHLVYMWWFDIIDEALAGRKHETQANKDFVD